MASGFFQMIKIAFGLHYNEKHLFDFLKRGFRNLLKELSFCNKLKSSNSNIFTVLWSKPLIFQT